MKIFQTSIHRNNETNIKFYRKVAFLMYTEMVNFAPQSWKAASFETRTTPRTGYYNLGH